LPLLLGFKLSASKVGAGIFKAPFLLKDPGMTLPLDFLKILSLANCCLSYYGVMGFSSD